MTNEQLLRITNELLFEAEVSFKKTTILTDEPKITIKIGLEELLFIINKNGEVIRPEL